MYAYRSHPGTIAACLLLSVGLHSATIGVNLCLTWALLGRSFDWVALIALIPLAHAGMAVPLTPGAVGVAEFFYGQLFAMIGIGEGLLVSVLQRLIWYSWALVGAAIFMLRRTGRRTTYVLDAPVIAATGGSDPLQ